MKTIKENMTGEIIIKNSRFITFLYRINNDSEVAYLINLIKNQYKNANHYCFAYIINDVKKSSDDGEPGGTAGSPMLQVLEKNDLNFVLAVVVRYFGGIKLGAGGLVRAYTKSITNLLNHCPLVLLEKGYSLTIEFDYNYLKQMDYLLKDINIKSKTFQDKIRYIIDVDKKRYDIIKNDANIKIININENLIEKMNKI